MSIRLVLVPDRRCQFIVSLVAAVGTLLFGLGLSPVAAAAAAGPSLASVSLQASDVAGFTAVSSDIDSLTDPNDQGLDQAFIQCAGSKALLDQFDAGPAAYDSPYYGKGETQFGTPKYKIASVTFGDGPAAQAVSAFTTLASATMLGLDR